MATYPVSASIFIALPVFEIALVLVRFDHVASFTRSVANLEGLSQRLKLNKAVL